MSNRTIITDYIRFGIEMFTAILTVTPIGDDKAEAVLDMNGGDFTPAEYGDIILDLLARNDITAENYSNTALRYRAFNTADGFPRLGLRIIDGNVYPA